MINNILSRITCTDPSLEYKAWAENGALFTQFKIGATTYQNKLEFEAPKNIEDKTEWEILEFIIWTLIETICDRKYPDAEPDNISKYETNIAKINLEIKLKFKLHEKFQLDGKSYSLREIQKIKNNTKK